MSLIPNDHGGLTYAGTKRVGEHDQRCDMLDDVRMIVEGLGDLCAGVRRYWPERYPVPPEIDALLNFQEYAIARVRAGSLKKLAEVCNASD